MNQTMRTLTTGMLALLVVGVLAGSTMLTANQVQAQDGNSEITISYSNFAPRIGFPHRHLQEWTRKLEQRTDGRVSVELHYGGSLLGAGETYSGVKAGIADAGLSLTSYDPRSFPLMSAFSLPLHLPNSTVASEVASDIVQEFQPEELEGLKVIAVFTTEPAYIQTTEPADSLEDLEGREMRTRGASIPIAEALGISAQGMPMPEVPEALQRGMIEGNITSREVLKDFRLAEFLPYIIDYPTDVGVFVAVMNQDKWNQLPGDVQTVINELRHEMTIWTGTYNDMIHTKQALRWARENHGTEIIELSEEEEERWDQRLDPLVEDWIEEKEAQGLPAREVIERIRELRDHYSELWDLDTE